MAEKVTWWGFATVIGSAVCGLCFWGYTDLRAEDAKIRSDFNLQIQDLRKDNSEDHKDMINTLTKIRIKMGIE